MMLWYCIKFICAQFRGITPMLLSCYTKIARMVIPIPIVITILLHKQPRIRTIEIPNEANKLIQECYFTKKLNAISVTTEVT